MNKFNQVRTFLDRAFNSSRSRFAPLFEGVVALLVFAMCGLFVWDSYVSSVEKRALIESIEFWITIFFIVEYGFRWWARGFSWKYILTPFAIIDLCSILPIFFLGYNFQFVRLLRLFRILRLVRFLSKADIFFGKAEEYQLKIVNILFSLFTLVFISSGVIFDIEHPHNQEFKTFFDGFYFSVVTLTTVGFGDIVPITDLGRAFTVLMIVVGITLIPWQVTNLAKSLISSERKHQVAVCANCGQARHDRLAKFCMSCGKMLIGKTISKI
jgi:voltage-gated potassium channel